MQIKKRFGQLPQNVVAVSHVARSSHQYPTVAISHAARSSCQSHPVAQSQLSPQLPKTAFLQPSPLWLVSSQRGAHHYLSTSFKQKTLSLITHSPQWAQHFKVKHFIERCIQNNCPHKLPVTSLAPYCLPSSPPPAGASCLGVPCICYRSPSNH